jgi:CTP:molybdopterin cytidylyltransferase MocA
LKEIHDPKWVWHVGLDASATEILNSLYNKETVDEATLSRIICLFKLEFKEANTVMSQIRGKPVYLGMAINQESLLKLKPQNVLFNLPLNPVS